MLIVCERVVAVAFFFVMIRPPSRSTLFPYTTLFRSDESLSIAILTLFVMNGEIMRHDVQQEAILKDRKSTRLNSSHEWISYAVFCLKKKKMKLVKLRDQTGATQENATRDSIPVVFP